MTKEELYQMGIEAATEFLALNGIDAPCFLTYPEAAEKLKGREADYFRRATRPPATLVGRGTGLYYSGKVFVNLPRTAVAVTRPAYRSWSWPGWKVDRTPAGVVAHEVGHHVEAVLRRRKVLTKDDGAAWRLGLSNHKKRVSGYEPVPDEAWAETMRLFILNPDLLRLAIPWRWFFLLARELRPVERLMKKGWKKVLSNDNYTAAAVRWIEG